MKRILCVLISIILIISSGCITFYITEFSPLYDDYVKYKKSGENIFKDRGVTIADYYSKKPTNLDIASMAEKYGFVSNIEKLYVFMLTRKSDIAKCTYLGRKFKTPYITGMSTIFEFEYNESVYGGSSFKSGDSIVFHSPKVTLHYYSVEELLLYSSGDYYEKGEQYLLFSNTRHTSSDLFIVCKLSGEYPSIKMFPGPIEYDATYFGAETKYVTADEFIQLFIDAVVEYGDAHPPKDICGLTLS